MAKLTGGERKCDVSGCNRSHIAKGLCKLHYYQMRRRGTLEPKQLELPTWVSETDLAWAAGFVDADGSILLERSNRTYKGSSRVAHTPRICAGSIDAAPLEKLKAIFGGLIVEQRHTNNSRRQNFRFYQWSVTNYRAVDTARLLMPFLVIKGVQAYLLSCFEYEAVWSKGGADPKMPAVEFERREALVEEMRHFNGRAYLERT